MNNKNRYPSLFFDSEKIKNIRKFSQKSFYEDEITAFYFIRPFSIYLSLFIVNKTNLSANAITFIMMLLSFFAPFVLFFITTLNILFIITPVLFFIIYSLDMIDGEVARLRKKTSVLGEFYDAGLWFSLPIYFSIYIYKICEFQGLPNTLFIITLLTVSFELFLLVSKSLFCEKEVFNFLNKHRNFKHKIILFFKFILSKQNIYILYPALYYFIDTFCNEYDFTFVMFWLGLLLLYNIYGIMKFNRIFKSIID